MFQTTKKEYSNYSNLEANKIPKSSTAMTSDFRTRGWYEASVEKPET